MQADVLITVFCWANAKTQIHVLIDMRVHIYIDMTHAYVYVYIRVFMQRPKMFRNLLQESGPAVSKADGFDNPALWQKLRQNLQCLLEKSLAHSLMEMMVLFLSGNHTFVSEETIFEQCVYTEAILLIIGVWARVN